jgi:hypothetical protein
LLGTRSGDAATHADAAVKAERGLEKAYPPRWARFATSRVCASSSAARSSTAASRMGEAAVDVVERLIYASLKEN